MMFTWINKQGVRSDAGFEVQSMDRFTIAYREGSDCVSVEVERGLSGSKPYVIVSPGAFTRWDGGALISPNQRAAMLRNFIEAMEFQGVGVEVD